MTTAFEAREQMKSDPQWWKIALMDFVDEFRRSKDPKMIEMPFAPADEKIDAVFAGVIETLCDELGIVIPNWLEQIPATRDPFFVSGMESLKALALAESPVHFRIRKVFVLANFLHRV